MPNQLGWWVYKFIIWLVVSTPLKNMKVSWNDYSQYMEKNMFQTTKQYSTNYHWSTNCHWSKTYPLCFMPTCQSGLIMPNEAWGFEHCSVFVLFLQCAWSELSWPNVQRQPQCSPSHHSPKFDSFKVDLGSAHFRNGYHINIHLHA